MYNDAGLLTSATNPESGTVTYTYNADNTLNDNHDAKGQDNGVTGLDYADQRYYASSYGRFNTPDRRTNGVGRGRPSGWNLYSYVLGDPANHGDRHGTTVDCEPDEDDSCECDPIQRYCPGGSGPEPGGGGGGGDCFMDCGDPPEPSPPVPAPEQPAKPTVPKTKDCQGEARVLQGNSALIGKPGGFSGDSVGTYPVSASGAAIILSQWNNSTKAALRPYIGQISGSGTGWSFTEVDDIVGGTPPPGYSNVQTALLALFPGKLIIELPGAPKDLGTTSVRLSIPTQLDCPDGTKEVHQRA